MSAPGGTVGALIVSYVSNEGYVTTDGTSTGSRPRLLRSQMYYESAYATKDGTIIEHADGAHGRISWSSSPSTHDVRGTSNRVGEFFPSVDGGVTPGKLTEVYPDNWEDHGTQAYDNLIYLYFDAIDSLVSFKHGVYSRAVTDTMVTRTGWTGQESANDTVGLPDVWVPDSASTSNSGTSPWTHVAASSGISRFPRLRSYGPPPSGRPTVHSTSATSSALIYVPSNLVGYEEQITWYNVHSAYSRQYDCAVIIGGANAGGPVGNYRLTVIIPSKYYGSGITPRYTALSVQLNRTLTTVDGAVWDLHGGRAACKFLNNYVYWAGGNDQGTNKSTLFRANILPVLQNPTTSLASTWVVERLADFPGGGTNAALLTADPYTNTLLFFSRYGVYMYDPTGGDWSTYATRGTWTSLETEASEYINAFTAGLPLTIFPHGDFVDERGTGTWSHGSVSYAAGSTQLRKTYFWGGWNGVDSNTGSATYINRYDKVRSIKVFRGHEISTLAVTAQNPENPAQTFGPDGIGPLVSGKHWTFFEANGYIYLTGGDWDYHYPVSVSGSGTTGYKVETGNGAGFDPNTQNGRQEIWRTHIATAAATGTSTWTMAGNAYAGYPWNGTAGVNDGSTKGPFMPDGVGGFVDASGQIWIGPCDYDYTDLDGSVMAGTKNTYAAMYKWSPPGANTTGFGDPDVVLGNGWTLPNQDRLARCLNSGSSPVGTGGVDYDISFDTGSNVGWGRPNKGPAYDSSDNKARVISVKGTGSAGSLGVLVSLYEFNCTEVAGKHTWTKTTTAAIPVTQIGGPAPAIQLSINTTYGTGGIGNTCQIGRTLYATFLPTYGVTAGNGNASSQQLKRACILAINLDTFPATSSVSYIPFPEKQNWFMRYWDGPQAEEAETLGVAPLTQGQYRSLVAVGTKLVLGPDPSLILAKDPFFSIYDTTSKTWALTEPPASYPFTNGGHDFPASLMSSVAVPSLGEVWLLGQGANSISVGGTEDQFRERWGMRRASWYQTTQGVYCGRRIVRIKVA